MEPKSALNNVMSQVGGTPVEEKQPGSRTDTLLSALRGLQSYAKATLDLNPDDEDLKMVRKMIMDLSSLLKKDQMEEGQEDMHQMPSGEMMPNSEMGGSMDGAPQMPDLSGIGLNI